MNKEKYEIKDPLDVANYVIKLDKKNNLPITNLQLQKVLFFLQGYFLSQYQGRLIACDFIKSKHGPIQKDVYDEFESNNEDDPIKKPRKSLIDFSSLFNEIDVYEPALDTELIPNLSEFNQLTQKLTKMSSDQLIKMSQDYPNWEKDKPKVDADQELKFSQDEIKECFDNNQAEFDLTENKSIKMDKNTDDLEF